MAMQQESSRMTFRPIILAGIFFISMANLGLEISLSRIFALSIGYHFAYLVISMALLGCGAAGTFLMVFPNLLRKNPENLLAKCTFMFSLSTLLSYLAVNHLTFFDPALLASKPLHLSNLFVNFLLLAIPFFFTGLTVSAAIYWMSSEAGKIYFSDLTGAGLGCLLPLILFPVLEGEMAIAVIIFLGLVSSFLLSFRTNFIFKAAIVGLAIICLLLIITSPALLEIKVSPYKDIKATLYYEDARLLETEWNAFSRVDLVESPLVRFAPGLSLEYMEPLPYQVGLTVDGSNLQAITVPEKGKMSFLKYLPSSLPYYLQEDPLVAVIDFGGGLDLLAALHLDAKSVVGIEQNPTIAKYFKHWSMNTVDAVYGKERLEIIVDDGRGFLQRREEKFDIIQIPLTDTLGAGAGFFSYGEDYRFTREAFQDYYRHLNEDGYLTITRYLRPLPMEEARVLLTLIEAMEYLEGSEDPKQQIMAVRSWGTITILLKKGEITEKDIGMLLDFSQSRKFDLVYYPDMDSTKANIYSTFERPVYHELFVTLLNPEKREIFLRDYLFDISPATDDAPFFYNYFTLERFSEIYHSTSGKWQILLEGGYLLPLVSIQAFILSVVFIITPIFIRKKRNPISTPRQAVLPAILYFILIGTAFMFAEIPIIYRFIRIFGNPTYSLAVVLFALLISSGLGSLFTTRHITNEKRGIIFSGGVIAMLILIITLVLPDISEFAVLYPLTARIAFTSVILFPLGFFMGMPFPLAMRLIGKDDKELIPWAWSANGTASVVSASLALTIAISGGFSLVLKLAAVAYLTATASIYLYTKLSRSSSNLSKHT